MAVFVYSSACIRVASDDCQPFVASKRGVRILFILITLMFILTACAQSERGEKPEEHLIEPVGLVIDLVVEEAWTMDEVARALTKQTGVPFVLAQEIDPHRRLRDPYTVMAFDQNLKEHLTELEEWGIWSFQWKDGTYVIHEL